jgi:cytoskeletal protein RodZ
MSSIGELLQEARKKKGLSEEAIGKVLRVKIQRLRDLEANKYDDFPAHLYARSFLKHYAEYLGLDSAPILERFNVENPPPERGPVFEITEEQRSSSASSATSIHRFPTQQHSSFPLTPTGKAIVLTTLLIIGLVGLSVYLMPRILPYFTREDSKPVLPQSSKLLTEPARPVHQVETFHTAPLIPVPNLTYSTNVSHTEAPGIP